MVFKVPTNVPQDLLLIQELVKAEEVSEKQPQNERPRASSIASSMASTDSEEEEAVEDLLEKDDGVKLAPASPSSADDSGDSSSPDSDSESESNDGEITLNRTDSILDEIDDEDEDGGNKQAAGAVLRTKNEIPEPSVVVPDFQEVDAHEPLEKVGEIMSIIENVVIVKGTPSPIENKAAERALDSDSLLVFEDRRVLGYVYETFGPTHLPMYQVKFPISASIDRSAVQLARTVYHVPTRSKFVFPGQLAKVKGSDASNVHDEEVGDDEVEFSDDEAEAAYKRQRTREREARRSSSVVSSRQTTPIPSQVRDQELMSEMFYGTSPYDEHTPYDMDTLAGPSRPTPLPYDDPYAEGPSIAQDPITDDNVSISSNIREQNSFRARGRHNRGRGRIRDDRHTGRSSSDRNNDRRSGGKNHGGGRRGGWRERSRQEGFSRRDTSEVHHERSPRPLSPTSLAIARATGQQQPTLFNGGQPVENMYGSHIQQAQQQGWQQSRYGPESMNYTFPTTQDFNFQPYVQPHINPRFASQFAMNFFQSQHAAQGYQYGGRSWNNTWLQNGGGSAPDNQQSEIANSGARSPAFSTHNPST